MTQNSALKLLLQKQITNEQYKIIDDYKKMAQHLEKQQQKNKSNSIKLQQLQKKISSLEFMTTTSLRESSKYQRKLEKLQNTQNYATQLLKLKYQSFVQMQNQHHHKHQECLTKRQQMAQNRKLSQSVHETKKNDKIKRLREQSQRLSMDHRRKSSEIQALTRQKKEQIKQQQLRLKDRKKRYQMFKLQRAAFNYNQKLQQEVSRFKQQTRYLEQLKKRVRKQEQIFRKTQILNRQTLKIESIYLTGAQH